MIALIPFTLPNATSYRIFHFFFLEWLFSILLSWYAIILSYASIIKNLFVFLRRIVRLHNSLSLSSSLFSTWAFMQMLLFEGLQTLESIPDKSWSSVTQYTIRKHYSILPVPSLEPLSNRHWRLNRDFLCILSMYSTPVISYPAQFYNYYTKSFNFIIIIVLCLFKLLVSYPWACFQFILLVLVVIFGLKAKVMFCSFQWFHLRAQAWFT